MMGDLPLAFSNAVTAVLGLIFGSFANVVIARLPEGKSVVRPGSHCPNCKKSIAWYDNIPLLSYLALGAKCRGCGKKISLRYPVVEAMMALLFLAAKVRFGWDLLFFIRDIPFLFILVVITFIDLDHRIIPDELSIGGLVLGLATTWAVPDLGWIQSVAGAAVGFGLFYGLAWSYQKYKGRMGLGGGDIKLLAMLGAFLGVQGVFTTILISSIAGTLIGILWAVATRQKNLMTSAIPFGPFLVIGGLYYYFFGDSLWLPFMTQT